MLPVGGGARHFSLFDNIASKIRLPDSFIKKTREKEREREREREQLWSSDWRERKNLVESKKRHFQIVSQLLRCRAQTSLYIHTTLWQRAATLDLVSIRPCADPYFHAGGKRGIAMRFVITLVNKSSTLNLIWVLSKYIYAKIDKSKWGQRLCYLSSFVHFGAITHNKHTIQYNTHGGIWRVISFWLFP